MHLLRTFSSMQEHRWHRVGMLILLPTPTPSCDRSAGGSTLPMLERPHPRVGTKNNLLLEENFKEKRGPQICRVVLPRLIKLCLGRKITRKETRSQCRREMTSSFCNRLNHKCSDPFRNILSGPLSSRLPPSLYFPFLSLNPPLSLPLLFFLPLSSFFLFFFLDKGADLML